MREKGEVTVFLAMILVMIMTLLLVMAESARTAGQRLYLRVASNSAMESLMAQYHRSLWNEYRILGLETDSKGLLEEEFKGFLEPYMKAKNWYPLKTEDGTFFFCIQWRPDFNGNLIFFRPVSICHPHF